MMSGDPRPEAFELDQRLDRSRDEIVSNVVNERSARERCWERWR